MSGRSGAALAGYRQSTSVGPLALRPAPARPSEVVLLTGATGYVGGRLLGALQRTGARVRCLTRRPEALVERVGESTQVVAGDLLNASTLAEAMAGATVAYYLVHSMGGADRFAEADRRAARNFAAAARLSGVQRIVYLGGLGSGEDLSSHLRSRQEVGWILRHSGVSTIELRASVVVGSGSASFEIVRSLVDSSPIMMFPRWADALAQPIGVEDLLDYLLAARSLEHAGSAVFEIGGPDRVSYADILNEYARQRGLRRTLVRVPAVPRRASALWLSLVTPVYSDIGSAMLDSLRDDTIVRDPSALHAFANRPRPFEETITRALQNEDLEFAETRWSDASHRLSDASWGGAALGRRRIVTRTVQVYAAAADAFAPVQRLGGETGWHYADRFWRARGMLDKLVGGVGLRRGRRHPVLLSTGDTVDFWRVERFRQDRLLRLAGELKAPGRIWLQFEVEDAPGGATLRQTAIFDPAGIAGLAYWYALYPVHRLVFGGMLRGIERAVKAAGVSEASGPGGPPVGEDDS